MPLDPEDIDLIARMIRGETVNPAGAVQPDAPIVTTHETPPVYDELAELRRHQENIARLTRRPTDTKNDYLYVLVCNNPKIVRVTNNAPGQPLTGREALFANIGNATTETRWETQIAGIFTTADKAIAWQTEHPLDNGGTYEIKGPYKIDTPEGVLGERAGPTNTDCAICGNYAGPTRMCQSCREESWAKARGRDADILEESIGAAPHPQRVIGVQGPNSRMPNWSTP